jgi:hypothetical protein
MALKVILLENFIRINNIGRTSSNALGEIRVFGNWPCNSIFEL